MHFLNPLDWGTLAFFFALPHLVMWLWKKRISTPQTNIDYILMGRKLTLPFFVTTLVSTWYGGIIGVTQLTFEKGLFNFLTQGLFWYVVYLIFAFVLVPKIKNQFNVQTLPELVDFLFGKKSRKIAAVLNFLHLLPIAYLISIGIMLQWLFHWPLWCGNLFAVVLVCIYLYRGGFKSLVISDFVQCIIMLSATAMLFFFVIFQYGGFTFLQTHLPSTHLELTGASSFNELFIWALIASSTLIDPNFYQRVYAARDEKTAKFGILISTIIWILFDLATTISALYARAAHPEYPSSEAYILFAMDVLPHGFRGFFLAGMIATIISTLDSFLFTSAISLSFDFKNSDKVHHHQRSLVLTAILCFLISLIFEDRVVETWRILGGLSASLLVAPVLFGIFWPNKLTDRDFCLIVLAGVVTIIFTQLSNLVLTLNSDSLIYGLYATVIMSVILSFRRRHS